MREAEIEKLKAEIKEQEDDDLVYTKTAKHINDM